MRTLLLALSLAAAPLAAPLALHAQAPLPAAQAPDTHEETQLERDTRALASELRCVVCQGLSLQDSPSPLAQEMRAVIAEQLAAGKSKEEVRAYFVDKYGEWVLLQPTASGFNLIVWLMPVLLLLAGAAFVYRTARKWTQAPPGSAVPAPTPDENVHIG